MNKGYVFMLDWVASEFQRELRYMSFWSDYL